MTGQQPFRRAGPPRSPRDLSAVLIEGAVIVGLRRLMLKVWPTHPENELKKMRGKPLPGRCILALCISSFLVGSLFTSRTWTTHPSPNTDGQMTTIREDMPMQDCDHKRKLVEEQSGDIVEKVTKTHQAINTGLWTEQCLDWRRTWPWSRTSRLDGRASELGASSSNHSLPKAFVVVGINTAFSSKRRRDSLRQTWLPRGEKLKKLEKEKGVVVRFVIGHTATPGGVLDRAIDAEDAKHRDFPQAGPRRGLPRALFQDPPLLLHGRLDVGRRLLRQGRRRRPPDPGHVGEHARDVSVQPRIYIGCMKSGPVLSLEGEKYHEPEFWKFGEEGNKYFRHATGQLYAISKDLAYYISTNLVSDSPILHRYANEDVSVGAWFIGLEVDHVDERSMCCGTPPDCALKAEAGNVCVAAFDWSCSGICKSVERMRRFTACAGKETALFGIFICDPGSLLKLCLHPTHRRRRRRRKKFYDYALVLYVRPPMRPQFIS
ncbi:Hexosyltransferase [Psidium guajava]|nr:Hexosyltransferase [Psidium guajava]